MNISVRVTAGVLAAGFLLSLGLPVHAKHHCTSQEKAVANQWLILSSRDRTQAIDKHLPWGAPRPATPSGREVMLVQQDYVIQYNGELRVPIWSAEHVVARNIGKLVRSECFRSDPRLKSDAASTTDDYDEKIFDRGHLSPSADFTSSRMSVHNSYIMSNMVPQFCQFNRGVWQILEGSARIWAKQYEEIYVLNGSVFDRDDDGVRDPDNLALRMTSRNGETRVAIPSAFFKVVVVREPSGSLSTLSVMMPNNTTDPRGDEAFRYLNNHVVQLATIERVTGLDLFPEARADIKEATELWPLVLGPEDRRPVSLTNEPDCKETARAYIRNGTYVLP